MKKILTILAAMLIMATAAAASIAQRKNYDTDGTVQFMNGNEFINIFSKTDAANVDPMAGQIYMKKSICGNATTRSIVNQGYSVVWIYPKGDGATVLTLDSCK
jgi:putative cell wall-binding protein